jgi:hypothetical protein
MTTTEPSRTRRPAADDPAAAARVAAVLSLVAGAWLVTSGFVLAYPFTVTGVDARLRETGLALVVVILSAGRVHAPADAWRSGVTVLAAGVVLAGLPFVTDVTRSGDLAVVWWNELLTGIAVVLTTGAGLLAGARAKRRGRPGGQRRS